MEDKESILSRVSKLVERQKQKEKDDPQEAENCALLIQKLLQKHNLDMQDIETHISESSDGSGGKITEISFRYYDDWELQLAQAISDNNFCFTINDPWQEPKSVIIVGKSMNVQVAIYLYNFYRVRLQEFSIKAYGEDIQQKIDFFKEQGIDPSKIKSMQKHEKTFLATYLIGGVHGIRSKFYKAIEQAKKESEKLTELIVFNDKAIDKYVEENYKLEKGKKNKSKLDYNSNAYNKGLEKGRNIESYSAIDGESGQIKIKKQLK